MSFTWSPDSKELVFDLGYFSQIYAVDSDGTNLRALIKGPQDNTLSETIGYPAWKSLGNTRLPAIPVNTPTAIPSGSNDVSPQGRIVFTSTRDGNRNIYTMNPDGSNVRRLTKSSRSDQYPSWSPDRQKIVFESWDGLEDTTRTLYTMSADGSNQTILSVGTNPAWSPDGKQIALLTQIRKVSGIAVMNSDGTNIRVLSSGDFFDQQPSWSPDSKQLIFHSNQDGTWKLYIMDADGTNRRVVGNFPGSTYQASWSPDGKQILFTSSNNGRTSLYIANSDGTNPQELTHNQADDVEAKWSPDGKQIVFVSYRDKNPEIYIMNADGSEQRDLTNSPADDAQPNW